MSISLFLLLVLVHSASSTTYNCDPTSACGCPAVSSVTVSAKIIGGENATEHAWTWMASLQYDEQHACGAIIISDQYALTAAQCVKLGLADLSRFTIVAGSDLLSDDSLTNLAQRRTITAMFVPTDYSPRTLYNDIAVLQFGSLAEGPLVNVDPICLPPAGQDPFVTGDSMVALGWGLNGPEGPDLINGLKQVTLVAGVTDSPYCSSEIGDPTLRFCAGSADGTKDTCLGDAGGPLMVFRNNVWVLAGIASWTRGCFINPFPSLYTRVSHYITFISDALESSSSSNGATTSSPGSGSGGSGTSAPGGSGGGSGGSTGCVLGGSVILLLLSLLSIYFMQ